jgi:energy-coupling factor transport system substrate-specific component
MWHTFFRRGENMEPNVNSGKKLGVYVAITILASSVCAVWIAWFNDLIGFVPFAALGSIITVNNAIAGLVLGPLFLLVLYPRVKRWGLLWTEIMRPDEVPAARFGILGNVLMWIGGIGALVMGLALGLGLYEQGFAAAGFASGGAGGIGIGLALLPFLVLIVVASFMLGGREQVEAAEEEAGSSNVS